MSRREIVLHAHSHLTDSFDFDLKIYPPDPQSLLALISFIFPFFFGVLMIDFPWLVVYFATLLLVFLCLVSDSNSHRIRIRIMITNELD